MRAWQRWHVTLCYACGRNLAYQSGAAVVKCPGCDSVLNVRGLALHEVAGQAECGGCKQIMVFRAAAAAAAAAAAPASAVPGLLCTTCSYYTPAPPPLFFNCAGCGLYVTYCARLPSVICAVCLTVFPPPSAPPPYPALAPLNPALRRAPRPPPALPPRRSPSNWTPRPTWPPQQVLQAYPHLQPMVQVPPPPTPGQPYPTTSTPPPIATFPNTPAPATADAEELLSPQPQSPVLRSPQPPPSGGNGQVRDGDHPSNSEDKS